MMTVGAATDRSAPGCGAPSASGACRPQNLQCAGWSLPDHRASKRSVLSKIQNGFVTYSLEPNTSADITIADPHRHEANMRPTPWRKIEMARNDLPAIANGDRAQWVGATILT